MQMKGWDVGVTKYGEGKRTDCVETGSSQSQWDVEGCNSVDLVGMSAESKVPEHVQVPWSGGPSPRAVPSNNRSKGLTEGVPVGEPSRGSPRASRLLQSFTRSSLKNVKYKSSSLPQPGSMAEEDAARILKAKNKIHDVFIQFDPSCRRLSGIAKSRCSGGDGDPADEYPEEDMRLHSAGASDNWCRSEGRRQTAADVSSTASGWRPEEPSERGAGA